MRVALLTEGAYPYHTSGTSSWCHQLVSGLGRYTYQLVALVGAGERPAPVYPLPGNVAGVTAVPVWDAAVSTGGRLARRRSRRAATNAAVLLCRALVGDGPRHATMFRDALIRLSHVAADGAHPLTGTPLAEVLTDAWRAGGQPERARPNADTAGPVAGGVPAPVPGTTAEAVAAGTPARLSLGDAVAAAALLEHALRPLAVPPPPVDVCHATCGGLPLLVALAAKWRAGTPYLLTEQGIYLRERYVDYGDALPEAVKAVMLRFFRALSRLGYAEATTIAAGSRFAQRWQLRHGAHPAKVVVVPGGVDPVGFPIRPEPPDQAVVWVGRIEPLKDLHTLIHAFRQVHRELPRARLRLVGPTMDRQYEAGCRTLVGQLGLSAVVEFTGPVAHASDAYAAGQVVARSSVCEGIPYAVIEAMMSGRATVSTDIGGVAELVGDAGRLVPPGDPAALARELTGLLRDPMSRRALGEAAHRRARGFLTLDRMLRAYDQLYTDLRSPPTPPRSWSSLGVSPGVSPENSMIAGGGGPAAGEQGAS